MFLFYILSAYLTPGLWAIATISVIVPSVIFKLDGLRRMYNISAKLSGFAPKKWLYLLDILNTFLMLTAVILGGYYYAKDKSMKKQDHSVEERYCVLHKLFVVHFITVLFT